MATEDCISVGTIQTNIYACESRDQIYEKNLKRHLELLDFYVPYWNMTIGAPCRLVVFPEFSLHGMPQNPDGTWNGVGIDIPGKETDLLGKKAKELNVYIAGHGWQEYPDFPGRPFSVGFLISPDGEVILKHHKIITSKVLECGDSSPYDAYDWFTEKFGDDLDAFFPVAETEFGKVGFQICGEGQYAEISRGLMMNGAEIIIRPNAWLEPFMTEPQDWMSMLSKFNSFTNMCYTVEANWGQLFAPGVPLGTGGGGSNVVDYTGRVLTKANDTGESGAASEINIQSLRRYREESGFLSRMVYMPSQIFKKVYETEMWPANSTMNREGSLNYQETESIRRQVIEQRKDIYTPSKK